MGTLKGLYTSLTIAAVCTACSSPSAALYSDPCAERYDSADFSSLLLPSLMAESYALREYIRNCLPHSLYGRIASGDEVLAFELENLDRIYVHALRLTYGNYQDALLICTLGTLTHKDIPFSFGLRFPLTTESDSLYNERTARLPRMIFCDVPASGDADKLQHFFASAYATLVADGEALPDAFGLLVELGESGFVENEAYDNRDIRTNRLGQLFARRLYELPALLPSQVFQEWNADAAQ